MLNQLIILTQIKSLLQCSQYFLLLHRSYGLCRTHYCNIVNIVNANEES